MAGWTTCGHENILYRRTAGKTSWENATLDCQTMNGGGHFATPRNAKQSECVLSLTSELPGLKQAWIGIARFHLYRLADNDSSVVEYTNWDDGEPKKLYGERCAVVRNASKGWSSSQCSKSFKYICQQTGEIIA